MIEVELTPAEMVACKIIGNMRTLAARSGAVRDAQMGKQNPVEIDEDGVIGEYAFCKHFNIFFDPSASPRSGSHDCFWRGLCVDVKTTRYKGGRLLATMKDNPDVNAYVLAILDGNKVRFPGYALKNDLRQEHRITDLGHGSGYAMEQKDLTQFHSSSDLLTF